MHLLVWTELQRLRVNQKWPITRMVAEQTVVLNHDGHTPTPPREGKFDFFVETPAKDIGFEVLTRPTKGKMIKKIAYWDEVDDFVFVIPHNALLPYQKTSTNHGWKVRPKYLPSLFGQKGLYAWLVDLDEQRIIARQSFDKLYFIEPQKNGMKATGKKSGLRRRP